MSQADHAPFGPSSISRVIQCPGSWRLCQQYPGDPEGPEAAEGTAAHWVLAEMYKGVALEAGTLAPNGIPVTEEMLEGAEMFIDAVGHKMGHIEERMPASDMLHPDNWGTPDAWDYRPIPVPGTNIIGGVIKLPDYKFGHRFVDVFKNWQLINYARLIIDALDLHGEQEQHTRIEFIIVQPRSYSPQGPVRKWSVLACDLRGEWNQIRSSILLAQSEQATCWVGPECLDCSARAFCTTLQRSSLAAIDESHRPTPMELPPPALGLELRLINRAIDRLKARASGLQEVALARVKSGTLIPGFRTEIGKGRERWNVPVAQIEALGAMMNGMKLTKIEPITPRQAVKAGLDAAVVAQFTITPAGETKLVEDDGSMSLRAFAK